ncbi:MAG: hypothetical protein JO089_02720 [Alphaproteobacteria bacterium]|nr:hypothetical protein [Alphaproteobacteria bacterium]
MSKLQDYNEEYHKTLGEEGFGPAIEAAYNAKRDQVIGSTVRGTVELTTTSFVRGAFLAAAVIVAGSALFAAGWYATRGATVTLDAVRAHDIFEAAMGGFNAGVRALIHPLGLIAAGAAGVANAYMAKRDETREENEALQQAKARQEMLALKRSLEAKKEAAAAPQTACASSQPAAQSQPAPAQSVMEKYNIRSCKRDTGLAAYINEQAAHAAATAKG